MKNELVLGIDVGTTNVKFLVADQMFNVYYSNSVTYSSISPLPNYCEIDPLVWKKIVLHELKRIFSLEIKNKIKAISVTGQMHSLVFLGERCEPVRNAILWNDKRTVGLLKDIKQKLQGNCNKASISTGNPLTNLLWVFENEKTIFDRICKICFVKDYITYVLCGAIVTDYTDASTSGLFDFKSTTWDEYVLSTFNIKHEILPKIVASGQIVGLMTEKVRNEIKADYDVLIICGAGDNSATIHMANKILKCNSAISLGTSGVYITAHPVVQESGKNILFKDACRHWYFNQMSISNCGKAIDWWRDITKMRDYPVWDDFSVLEILQNEIIFVPYFSGEKYVLKNPNLRASFHHLEITHTSKQMWLSILEGICFGLKLFHEQLVGFKSDVVVVVGGGSINELWMRLMASIFEMRVIRSKKVSAVYGVILLALEKMGYDLNNLDIELDVFGPDSWLVDHYRNKYRMFIEKVGML